MTVSQQEYEEAHEMAIMHGFDWEGLKAKMRNMSFARSAPTSLGGPFPPPGGWPRTLATATSECDPLALISGDTASGIYPLSEGLLHNGHPHWKPEPPTTPPRSEDKSKPPLKAYPRAKHEEMVLLESILMSEKPSEAFLELRASGALETWMPELNRLFGVPQRAEHHPEVDTGIHVMMVLDMAARLHAPFPVRFACLVHDFGKGTTPVEILPRHHDHETRSADLLWEFAHRFPVPRDDYELAYLVAIEHGNFHRSGTLDSKAIVRLLERCDAFDQPERFHHAVQAAECDHRGRLGQEERTYVEGARLLKALDAALSVNPGAIRLQQEELGRVEAQVIAAIKTARVYAVRQALKT